MEDQQFKDLVDRARQAASAYYNSDTLLMTDSEYDALLAQITEAKAQHPEWDDGGLIEQVAADVGAGDVQHSSRMLSLAKVKTEGDLAEFVALVPDAVVEPKMDGLAVSAKYLAGRLTQVVTRGDGSAGEDVTAQAQKIAGLPTRLSEAANIEVRGEVFMTDADFEIANQNRTAAGKPAFANPRNATAGTLRAQGRTYEAPMSFACYEALYDHPPDSYMARLAIASTLGIQTINDLFRMKPMPPLDAVREIERLRPTLGFPIDGAVLKVNSEMVRRQLGETSHSPRWAVAFKYAADTATTRLLDIEIAIGRTGRLSLTAILEPVYVGGTTISRATLHHPQFVLDADLRIGDEVYVYRAGDVIPRVTTPVLSARPEGLPRWTPPETCPQCGEPLEKEGLIWRCLSPECSVAGRIRYFADRDVIDIDGLDFVTAEALAESGLVSNVADLFNLTREQLANLPVGTTTSGQPRLLGQKTADRILSSLAEKTKTQPFARVITSLGIRNVGRSMGQRLAERFKNMEALRNATVEDLASVEGIGPTKAERIRAGLTQMDLIINRLIQAGVQTEIEDAVPVDSSLPLAGKKVCVTGVVPGMSRSDADMAIYKMGGTPVHSLSKNTDLVVIGEAAGSKADKARELGTPIMEAQAFADLFDSQV